MTCTNEIQDPTEIDTSFPEGHHPPTQMVSRKCRYLVNRTQPQAHDIEKKVDSEGLSHVGGRCPFLANHAQLTVCPWHNK